MPSPVAVQSPYGSEPASKFKSNNAPAATVAADPGHTPTWRTVN